MDDSSSPNVRSGSPPTASSLALKSKFIFATFQNRIFTLSNADIAHYIFLIEVDSIPVDAKYYFNEKFSKVSKKEYEEIQAELEELDKIVPRVVEDILEQGGFVIHQSKIDIINKKEELRNKINI